MEIEAEAAEIGHRTGRRTARKARPDEVVEVVTRGETRRSWSADQKRRIVVEAMQPGVTPTEVIRRWGLTSKPACPAARRIPSSAFVRSISR